MTSPADRTFTDDELTALARPFRDQLQDALADGPTAALAVLEEAHRAEQASVRGYQAWAASIQAWAQERDPGALAGLAAITIDAMAWRPRVPPPSRGSVDEVRAAISGGDTAAAVAAFDRLEAELRYLHDVGLDWVCSLLTWVLTTHGIDGLEASLRRTGDQTLLAWMPRDVEHDPRTRLTQWARMLKGNFAAIRLEEDAERFTITQDPCGSCGRQLAECAYPGPLGLALVADAHPLTRGGTPTTVYRTHAVLMHELVPLERLGVPWPVVGCPPGLTAGPCRILLYKDPADPRAVAHLPGRGPDPEEAP